jgi:hypothetical protein
VGELKVPSQTYLPVHKFPLHTPCFYYKEIYTYTYMFFLEVKWLGLEDDH